MSERDLREMEKSVDLAMKSQVQDGLARIFTELSCKGVAEEIKVGKNVTWNAEYGFRICVHGKLGPRVDVETYVVTPQTSKAKKLEEKFVKNMNLLLKSASYPEMSSTLLFDLRTKDRIFERRMAEKRKQLEKAS